MNGLFNHVYSDAKASTIPDNDNAPSIIYPHPKGEIVPGEFINKLQIENKGSSDCKPIDYIANLSGTAVAVIFDYKL